MSAGRGLECCVSAIGPICQHERGPNKFIEIFNRDRDDIERAGLTPLEWLEDAWSSMSGEWAEVWELEPTLEDYAEAKNALGALK